MARQATARVGTCQDCGGPYLQPERYAYCEPCRQEHSAKWKEEHTRHGVEDKRPGWLIGDLCTVKLGKVRYDAKILDMSDVSRRESNYDLVKLELTRTLQGFSGEPITNTWIYPEPVQTYKLRKRYLSDPTPAMDAMMDRSQMKDW